MLATQYGVKIAAGDSLSSVADLSLFKVTGFIVPSNWTTAGLSFQASVDNVTYYDVYTTSAELTVAVAASHCVLIDEDLLEGVRYLKVRSGTTGAPVVQVTASTVIMLGVAS